MKTALKITSVALVVVMLCVALASCGITLSGVYSSEGGLGSLAGAKTSYNFKPGNKVTRTDTGTLLGSTSSTETDGKYEIKKADDGTLSIKFTWEKEDGSTNVETKAFAENKDAGTITIGSIVYTKQK